MADSKPPEDLETEAASMNFAIGLQLQHRLGGDLAAITGYADFLTQLGFKDFFKTKLQDGVQSARTIIEEFKPGSEVEFYEQKQDSDDAFTNIVTRNTPVYKNDITEDDKREAGGQKRLNTSKITGEARIRLEKEANFQEIYQTINGFLGEIETLLDGLDSTNAEERGKQISEIAAKISRSDASEQEPGYLDKYNVQARERLGRANKQIVSGVAARPPGARLSATWGDEESERRKKPKWDAQELKLLLVAFASPEMNRPMTLDWAKTPHRRVVRSILKEDDYRQFVEEQAERRFRIKRERFFFRPGNRFFDWLFNHRRLSWVVSDYALGIAIEDLEGHLNEAAKLIHNVWPETKVNYHEVKEEILRKVQGSRLAGAVAKEEDPARAQRIQDYYNDQFEKALRRLFRAILEQINSSEERETWSGLIELIHETKQPRPPDIEPLAKKWRDYHQSLPPVDQKQGGEFLGEKESPSVYSIPDLVDEVAIYLETLSHDWETLGARLAALNRLQRLAEEVESAKNHLGVAELLRHQLGNQLSLLGAAHSLDPDNSGQNEEFLKIIDEALQDLFRFAAHFDSANDSNDFYPIDNPSIDGYNKRIIVTQDTLIFSGQIPGGAQPLDRHILSRQANFPEIDKKLQTALRQFSGEYAKIKEALNNQKAGRWEMFLFKWHVGRLTKRLSKYLRVYRQRALRHLRSVVKARRQGAATRPAKERGGSSPPAAARLAEDHEFSDAQLQKVWDAIGRAETQGEEIWVTSALRKYAFGGGLDTPDDETRGAFGEPFLIVSPGGGTITLSIGLARDKRGRHLRNQIQYENSVLEIPLRGRRVPMRRPAPRGQSDAPAKILGDRGLRGLRITFSTDNPELVKAGGFEASSVFNALLGIIGNELAAFARDGQGRIGQDELIAGLRRTAWELGDRSVGGQGLLIPFLNGPARIRWDSDRETMIQEPFEISDEAVQWLDGHTAFILPAGESSRARLGDWTSPMMLDLVRAGDPDALIKAPRMSELVSLIESALLKMETDHLVKYVNEYTDIRVWFQTRWLKLHPKKVRDRDLRNVKGAPYLGGKREFLKEARAHGLGAMPMGSGGYGAIWALFGDREKIEAFLRETGVKKLILNGVSSPRRGPALRFSDGFGGIIQEEPGARLASAAERKQPAEDSEASVAAQILAAERLGDLFPRFIAEQDSYERRNLKGELAGFGHLAIEYLESYLRIFGSQRFPVGLPNAFMDAIALLEYFQGRSPELSRHAASAVVFLTSHSDFTVRDLARLLIQRAELTPEEIAVEERAAAKNRLPQTLFGKFDPWRRLIHEITCAGEAAPFLDKAERKQLTDYLTALLTHDIVRVRGAAFAALGKIHPPAVLRGLLEALVENGLSRRAADRVQFYLREMDASPYHLVGLLLGIPGFLDDNSGSDSRSLRAPTALVPVPAPVNTSHEGIPAPPPTAGARLVREGRGPKVESYAVLRNQDEREDLRRAVQSLAKKIYDAFKDEPVVPVVHLGGSGRWAAVLLEYAWPELHPDKSIKFFGPGAFEKFKNDAKRFILLDDSAVGGGTLSSKTWEWGDSYSRLEHIIPAALFSVPVWEDRWEQLLFGRLVESDVLNGYPVWHALRSLAKHKGLADPPTRRMIQTVKNALSKGGYSKEEVESLAQKDLREMDAHLRRSLPRDFERLIGEIAKSRADASPPAGLTHIAVIQSKIPSSDFEAKLARLKGVFEGQRIRADFLEYPDLDAALSSPEAKSGRFLVIDETTLATAELRQKFFKVLNQFKQTEFEALNAVANFVLWKQRVGLGFGDKVEEADRINQLRAILEKLDLPGPIAYDLQELRGSFVIQNGIQEIPAEDLRGVLAGAGQAARDGRLGEYADQLAATSGLAAVYGVKVPAAHRIVTELDTRAKVVITLKEYRKHGEDYRRELGERLLVDPPVLLVNEEGVGPEEMAEIKAQFGENVIVHVGAKDLATLQTVHGEKLGPHFALITSDDDDFLPDTDPESWAGERPFVLKVSPVKARTGYGAVKATMILLRGLADEAMPSFLRRDVMHANVFIYVPAPTAIDWTLWMAGAKAALAVGSAV